MKKGKKSVSVFRQLVMGYVLFSVLLVVGINICMFGVLIGLSGGNIKMLAPYEMVDKEGNIGDISAWEQNGGWIEKLDEEYHVLEVYGEKQDEPQKYTQEEIYEYLNIDKSIDTNTSASMYRGFIKSVEKDGRKSFYLMKISRNILSLTYNYNVNNSEGGGKIALICLGAFFLFFCANCFLMGRYLSRKIKRPLNEITTGMDQVIQNGVEQVQLDFYAQKEFEEIRDKFNIMTERLEHEKRQKRISEEKKNRMLLELSHDVKTPVSTIKSYANALEEGLIEDEKQNECYRIIDEKAGRVDMLINDMSLLLKLNDTEFVWKTEKTDLCELVRTCCTANYAELEAAGIEMECDIPDAPIWADIEKKEFTRVMENLLGNICKYNETGHKAWVELKKNKGKAEIIIMDDGEAIAEDICAVMFDPFVRGDKARSSKGGTGLGLAIARKIMEKLGGTIAYEYTEGKNYFRLLF